MLEEISRELSEKQNVRANLIQLRQLIKEADVMDEWREYHAKHPVLYAFLSDEDAKVRKNAALVLGATAEPDAVKALFDAYQKEDKLFVKSSYLTAMEGLDISPMQEALKKRQEELLSIEPLENEKKHIQEELHALDRLVRRVEGVKKHKFTGYEEAVEVILTTNPEHREVTAAQLKAERPVLIPTGVKVKTMHLREVSTIRTFREMLFILNCGHHVAMEPEQVAHAFVDSNLLELLDSLHEGDGAFYFRMDIKGRIGLEERGNFIRRAAAQIEELSGHRLMNSADEYEIELRLIMNKDGTLYPALKLYTIPMRRFSYRKNAIAASIHPATAALLMRLAEPYLKEKGQALDPFCGVGTMLIERDMLVAARDMYGTDIFGEAILKARENASAAGRLINFINRDFFEFKHQYLFDEIVTNMPVRGRKSKDEQDAFYGRFFERASSYLTADGVMILYTNESGFVKKQLRLHKEYCLLDEYCIRKKDGFYLFIIGVK